ncbi:AAA family ATPase [Pseudomonas aeruginosa]|uniref:AAA family ATPase n=1 Tax=Pseudomonas aeruginosa TaxID=287 RepID=UPI0009A8D58C|nr:AAA family ATPase [Pseudomonas aeruginosa]MCO3781941.1 hypothetical protein [Pseudomonas aeruginosa]MEB6159532.1 AAA family ATPase [Pseudomonas aeruginosa]RTU17837.1 hypothetical protein DY968_15040 [Pseudomonas aeruginosa]SQC54891.1 Predicted ATPase (AAA+ superfamily) [Pseudomonas aeruginosa]
MLTPNDVFTPGSLPIRPTNIYAARGESEQDFRKALRRNLIPVVFGEYGVGKTSMARHVLKEKDEQGLLINIESVADKTIEDIFSRCLEKLGYSVQTSYTTANSKTNGTERSMQAGASSGGFNALIVSKRTESLTESTQAQHQFVVTSPTDSKLIEICEEAGAALLIDELHRASATFASDLSKFIKSFGNSNCKNFKIALLGTSSDASKLVSSDPGIDRLIQEVHLKAMTEEECFYVVNKGMTDLHINCPEAVTNRLVRSCVGSPSILQYLSLEAAELAFDRTPRQINSPDIDEAIRTFVETKEARLNKSYLAAIETTGELRYRKQILRAIAECEDEYVTMEDIRTKVSGYLEKDIPSTALSGPLRDLKTERFGMVLTDVERPDGAERLNNYTTFKDPALKAFIRLQVLREEDS